MFRTLSALSIVGTMLFALPLQARPYPDTVAVCYSFSDADLEAGSIRPETCVVSAGYGAGGDYTILNWHDGSATQIIGTDRQDSATGEWVRRYQVTDEARGLVEVPVQYEPRGVWFETNPMEPDAEISCYEIANAEQVFCYRIP